jgi:excisionase family DNA binding protein
MTRLLKVPEAALRLNISEKTTWKMVYARRVDVVRIGRSVRIPENSIEKLIDDGTIPADLDDQN